VTVNFTKRTYTAAIFFDVSESHDTVWKPGILHEPHTAGMQDSMLCLLKSYRAGWKFRVKQDSRFSVWKQIHGMSFKA
jgi:hypothetical protein